MTTVPRSAQAAFAVGQEELVRDARQRRSQRMSRRERVAATVVGAGFAGVAAAMLVLLPDGVRRGRPASGRSG